MKGRAVNTDTFVRGGSLMTVL